VSFIRMTSEEAFEPTGFPGYTIQMLAYPEAATFINSRVAAGGHAADRHVHDADQLYYVVEGQMHVELGEARHRAGADSLVFIPAGLPHRNWNEGPATEFHFEIIVPSARPGRPLLTLVDGAGIDAASVKTAEGQDGYVVAAVSPPAEVVILQKLTRPSAARPRIDVSVCDEPAQSPSVDRHTHDFHQFYYLLRGCLTVEVGGETHEAGERTLVMLPAGVPHRSANRSGEPVRYLVVNIPGQAAQAG
jgi:mannose-6-phosphate isomerase-like protein (cupin superfamily)